MAGNAPGGPRRKAVEKLEKTRVRLFSAGGASSLAIEKDSESLFDFLNDSLDASPAQWLKNGMAFWVRAYGAQAEMYQKVCDAWTKPFPPSEPRSGIIDGTITFFIDQYSQSSDSVLTNIGTDADVTASDLRFGAEKIPSEAVAFSGRSDGTPTYVVTLAGLGQLTHGLPPGTYKGELTWPGGSQPIAAVLGQTG